MEANKIKLNEIVLSKKQEANSITANPTLDAFDLEYCVALENLRDVDSFVKSRVNKCVQELILAGGVDYNDHFRNAFDFYNEAVCYYLLKQKGFGVKSIHEQENINTPDFEVEYSFNNVDGNRVKDSFFIEVKALAFGDGNNEYNRVQQRALLGNISMEEQHQRGHRVTSAFYQVSPLGSKDVGISAEIELLNQKISNNIKSGQYTHCNKDTLLWVDLSQYLFPFDVKDCLPIYPDLPHRCSISGRLWMLAFAKENERIFSCCEFEGQGNFDNELTRVGILNEYEYIKGIIFSSGSGSKDKTIIGLYRSNDQDRAFVSFLYEFCDFVNDDVNSKGFKFFL